MLRWLERRTAFALIYCASAAAPVFVVGCKGGGSGGQGAEGPPAAAGGAVTEANGAELDVAQPRRAGARSTTLQVAADPRRFQLPLPAQGAFVTQPLPPEDAARAKTFEERSRITVGRGYLQQLDLFPGERALLVSSGDEASVRVYDRESKRLLGNFPTSGAGDAPSSGALAWPELGADGAPLFVTGDAAGIALFSAGMSRVGGAGRLAVLDPRPSQALRWSADGSVLVSKASDMSSQTSVLHFYRRSGLTLVAAGALSFDERVEGWDLSRDNRLLALSHYPSDALRVIDLHTGLDVLRVPGPTYAVDVSLSPDGRLVAVGGQGLLVVDLLNPDRRAFYAYLQNNIGSVRFSPGGAVLAVSAFDGRVRLLQIGETTARTGNTARGLELNLLRELKHAGPAVNVYTVVFEADGQGLLSSSGDKTVRWFRAAKSHSSAPAPQGPSPHFRTLEKWRQDEPQSATPWPAPREPALVDGHYQPVTLEGPPRPTRLRPGRYTCKITSMYRLRGCSVTRDARGHTLLEFASDNLLGLRGVVYDAGPVVRFEGWLTEPSTLMECQGCDRQPIHGILRGDGKRFRGLLTFRHYYDPHQLPAPPAPDTKIEEALDRYPIELNFEGPELVEKRAQGVHMQL